MNHWKQILLSAPLIALSLTAPVQAKDHWKHHSEREWKHHSEKEWKQRNRYDNRTYGYYGNNPSYYGNRGYTGRDLNRDGAIERYEWRGNDRSFYRHDRDGDGVITPRDRAYRRDNRRYDAYPYRWR